MSGAAPAKADISALEAAGFQVQFLLHANAILSVDFPDTLTELCSVLLDVTIPIEEIIAGGGGEAKGTQRLRKSLAELSWPKTEFVAQKWCAPPVSIPVSPMADTC